MYVGGAIMAGGRPRTVSPQPEDLVKLGEEMVDWVKSHPDIVHICEWWCIEKEFLESQWETMIKRPEFVSYYEIVMRLVGLKYISKDSKVRDNISARWQRVYFKDLRKSEDADLDAEAERSKKVAEVTIPPLDYVRELERKIMVLEHQHAQNAINAD